ncbi:MAG: transglutaminase N-terminal domain-containing protein [Dehalococcoidia bacterium]
MTRLRHTTTYRYDRPVRLGPHLVRLRPAPTDTERIAAYTLGVAPEPGSLRWQQDPLGNWVARLLFAEPVSELRLDVDLTVDMTPKNPFDFLVEPSAETWPLTYTPETLIELRGCLEPDPAGQRFAAFVSSHRARAASGTLESLLALNRAIYERIRYVVRDVGEVWAPEETLELGRGSCRDSAWLLVQALRHLGCGARFVSGYLLPLDLPGVSATEGAGAGLHAWAAVYLPGAGWVGLDPTSGTLCSEAHLPLAATTHYLNAAPITGTSELANVDVTFDFHTERLHPRPVD